MMYTALPKRMTAVDLFLDMREEARLQEEGYMDSSFDDEDEGWGYPYSAESPVDEIDRLNDLAGDLDSIEGPEWALD